MSNPPPRHLPPSHDNGDHPPGPPPDRREPPHKWTMLHRASSDIGKIVPPGSNLLAPYNKITLNGSMIYFHQYRGIVWTPEELVNSDRDELTEDEQSLLKDLETEVEQQFVTGTVASCFNGYLNGFPQYVYIGDLPFMWNSVNMANHRTPKIRIYFEVQCRTFLQKVYCSRRIEFSGFKKTWSEVENGLTFTLSKSKGPLSDHISHIINSGYGVKIKTNDGSQGIVHWQYSGDPEVLQFVHTICPDGRRQYLQINQLSVLSAPKLNPKLQQLKEWLEGLRKRQVAGVVYRDDITIDDCDQVYLTMGRFLISEACITKDSQHHQQSRPSYEIEEAEFLALEAQPAFPPRYFDIYIEDLSKFERIGDLGLPNMVIVSLDRSQRQQDLPISRSYEEYRPLPTLEQEENNEEGKKGATCQVENKDSKEKEGEEGELGIHDEEWSHMSSAGDD